MRNILINCDIGERGVDHETDLAIMPHIQVANIACGGHAGDRSSARFFADLAERYDVLVTAHLSYPDRENFGRVGMNIGGAELRDSLDAQRECLPEATRVKFHGALYNDACVRESLAEALADWISKRGITLVLTPGGSALDASCRRRGLRVMAEFFAERRYMRDSEGHLVLTPRSRTYSGIHDCGEALEQVRRFVETGRVRTVVAEEKDGSPVFEEHFLDAETICVHSDSPIALKLVRALADQGYGRKNA